jgi:hypothetical protein
MVGIKSAEKFRTSQGIPTPGLPIGAAMVTIASWHNYLG